MRDAFHDELDSIGQTLIDMGNLVGTAVQLATTALLTADLKIAEQVISEDTKIDNMQHELDAKTLNILAREQPVAGDLRTLITSL
ncbi:MAG: phosphate transport system regulatory protein PhoU, partial [Actinobacteria bacterium]|nr:phosphate transport system regulatory protein PhoU [Actinomycetota bacterium]